MITEAFGLPIRTLSDGEQITENGLYYVPMSRYHRDPDLCDGFAVSNSRLRLVDRCPEKLKARYDEEEGESDTKATTFGRMAHALCIEGRFPSDIAVSPFRDFSSNEGKEGPHEGFDSFLKFKKAWKAEQEAAGKTIFRQDEIDDVYSMAERLAREPMVKDGLFSGPLEVTVAARDPETGIWMLARPDSLPTDTIWGDYKTTRSADPEDLRFAIKNYGYHCQAAFSAEVIARATGRVLETFALIAQEKKSPFVVTIAPIDDEAIEWGARENRRALRRLEHCIKTDSWPAYSEGPVTVGLPANHVKWLRENDALFPQVPSLKEIANARYPATV
ncbi:MAG: PD-(D/E)XK nuclease-like domain-containing protein [Acidobacteria bacterium]|nr:PD-(D/E)XK nuclease-like domain-containing protein [Acidobacteriota bacterium]